MTTQPSDERAIKLIDSNGVHQPVKLNANGELKVETTASALPSGAATSANQTNGTQQTKITDAYGFTAECSPMDELRVAKNVKLIGSTFGMVSGLTPTTGTTGTDPSFWTGTNANGSTIAQTDNQVLISSSTATNGAAILQSVRSARYVSSISNRFKAVVQLGDIGVASNTRRWGVFNGTEGAYFELAGTTLSACLMKGSSRVAVAALTAPTTSATTYEIYYTNSKVYFVISGTLVATHTASSATWSATLNLPCRADNTNAGSSTNSTISIWGMTIIRIGELETATIYKSITGVNASQICKYGAGRLHSIIVGTPVKNATIAVYDNVTGTTGKMMLLTLPENAVPMTIEVNTGFYTGLNVVPSSTSLDFTVIYE